MEDKIIGFLEINTDTDKVWSTVDEIIDGLYPNLINDDKGINIIIKIGEALYKLDQSGSIRVQSDMNIITENKTKVALESNVSQIFNEIKTSALDEMNKVLNTALKKEDYETATEYRDMIEKYS